MSLDIRGAGLKF